MESYLVNPFQRRQGVRTLRCISCRKLKIKCDRKTPTCEYCLHTNRKCVYPVKGKKSRPQRKFPSLSYTSPSKWAIVTDCNFLGITPYEFQLVRYYHRLIEADYVPSPVPQLNEWFNLTQRMALHSSMVRNCVFAISTLHLDKLDFYNVINAKSESPPPVSFSRITAYQEVFDAEPLIGYHESKRLQKQTMTYFQNSLANAISLISRFQECNGPRSSDEAIEVLLSSLILLNLLLHHDTLHLPLISVKPDEANLLSVYRGMKLVKEMIMPHLQQTSFGLLFNESNYPSTNSISTKISIVEHLTDYRLKLEKEGEILTHESSIYVHTTQMLEKVIYMLIMGDANAIHMWFFSLEDEFYTLSNRKHYFACKLLFYYSALRVLVVGQTGFHGDTWTDYCDWYENYNQVLYGGWRDVEDSKLHEVALLHEYEMKDILSFLGGNEVKLGSSSSVSE